MNVGIGTVDAQFLSWEYLFRIFGIVYLQCIGHQPKFVSLSLVLLSHFLI
jgi:hypothetical protein